MKISEQTQEFTITFEELKIAAERNYKFSKVLEVVESQIGYKLNSETLLHVKTDQANIQERLQGEALYAKAVAEADTLIQSNDVYRQLYFGSNLEESYKRWCTPELFYYLELNTYQALEEIRAACYPAIVSYAHNTWVDGDKKYRTPYLSFKDSVDPHGNTIPREKNTLLSFYMVNNREVKISLSEVCETYTERDLGKKKWNEFAFQREKKIAKKTHMSYLADTFLNIKTGVKTYVMSEQLTGDAAPALGNYRTNKDWYKTWEGSECNLDHLGDNEKAMIVEKGRACIHTLHQSLFDIKGLHRNPQGLYVKSYEREI